MRPAVSLPLTLLLTTCGWLKVGPEAAAAKEWDPEVHEWIFEPTVLVCYTAPVSVVDVQEGLDVWAKHGAPQLQAYADPCYTKHTTTGLVYVDLPTWQLYDSDAWTDQTVGLTTVYSISKDGPIFAADVALMTDSEETLIHELGHLWIGSHYPGQHVMAEWVEDFSWSFKGTQKAFRD